MSMTVFACTLSSPLGSLEAIDNAINDDAAGNCSLDLLYVRSGDLSFGMESSLP